MIPSTDVIQVTLTLKMTTAQVVETSVTVNNNSPIQDYVHPDDQTQPIFEMTPGFKPFTVLSWSTTISFDKANQLVPFFFLLGTNDLKPITTKSLFS